MTNKIAFIGLGTMGYPMAGHLAKSGLEVTVFNRTTSKAGQWAAEFGCRSEPTPAAAAATADIVMTCVGNDDDLRHVVLGKTGALAGMKAGAILVDHTTASAQVAEELARACESSEVEFLDAPVSGGQAGAENGKLTVMVGGNLSAFDRVEPIISRFAQRVRLMGPVGSGQRTKMVNQICIAGLLQGLAEGLHFADAAGIDAAAVIDVISKGAAQSWQMDNRSDTMLADEYDHGFAVKWMRKDLDIVLSEARQNGATLPVTALVDQFYADIAAMGGEHWDTSSLLTRLSRIRSANKQY